MACADAPDFSFVDGYYFAGVLPLDRPVLQDPLVIVPDLLFSIIQLGKSYVLAPRILGRSVGLSAFTLLFSMAAFTALLGFAGALLALPAAAVMPLAAERVSVLPRLAQLAR